MLTRNTKLRLRFSFQFQILIQISGFLDIAFKKTQRGIDGGYEIGGMDFISINRITSCRILNISVANSQLYTKLKT